MRRRDFIAILGGAAWMSSAGVSYAQLPQPVRRIGYLAGGGDPDDPEARARRLALLAELGKLGWTNGRNLHVEARTGGTVKERDAFAGELRSLAPDLLVAAATSALTALRDETRIPIVFIQVADPVGDPRVASLARPGGNVTGFTNFEFSIAGKWLQILKEIAPTTERVLVLLDAQDPQFGAYIRAVEAAASDSHVDVDVRPIVDAATIETTIDAIAGQSNTGMLVLPGPTTFRHRSSIIDRAAFHAVPSVYPYRYHAHSGGLVSYGIDTIDLFRRAAAYVDRVLRGENPGDLPIQQPTRFELVLNLKTAKALGLAVPPSLLARADEVIE